MDDSLFATNTFGLWWVWRPAYPSHLAVVLRSAPKQSVAYVSSSGTSWETGPPPPPFGTRGLPGLVGHGLLAGGSKSCERAHFWATYGGSRVERMSGATRCRRKIKSIQEVQARLWAWSFRSSALPQLGLSCFSFTMILVRAF